jgi:hypothetical protein
LEQRKGVDGHNILELDVPHGDEGVGGAHGHIGEQKVAASAVRAAAWLVLLLRT